jgi:outer membrane protein OmpA-like peptidoglycan-associated protein
MKWKLVAALLTVCAVESGTASPADACGVKLTIKSSAPRKAVAHTSNPSEVLLVGNPPRRLERDLVAAGHKVEVVPTPAAAKRQQYAVVIVDSKQQDDARAKFASSTVVVRSGDVDSDVRSVEQQVARRPVRTDERRDIVAVRPTRTPIAAGPAPDPNAKPIGGRDSRDTQPVETTPPPQPVKVVAAVQKTDPKPIAKVDVKPPVAEVRTSEDTPPPETTKPKQVAKVGSIREEVYFGLASAESQTGPLVKAVRWLNDNSDAHVIIEGHADPTGSPDANLALGQKRAEWVRDYLVTAGIDSSRLEVISYGDTRLKYGRTDRRNRRVAIVPK